MLRSIRFRLTLWYSSIVAVTFALVALATYQIIARQLMSSLDESVITETRWMAARIDRADSRHEPAEAFREEIREHAAYYPFKEYIEIYDSAGAMLFRSANLEGDTLARFAGSGSPQHVTLATVTTFRDHVIRLGASRSARGAVYLAMPMERVTTAQDQLLGTLAWMGPAVLVFAVAGGTFLAKKSLAKVEKVTGAAQRISADRMSERIPEEGVDDEIGNLISTFNAMLTRLDASFEQMKQFSGDASHELRTPLAVIRTQLETALNAQESNAETKRIIAQCLDEAIRMSGIIENLLLLAKSDAGQAEVHTARVDLKTLMEQTYEESIILASEMAIHVTLRRADDAVVRGDEPRLRQMLLNLIDNAIKYGRQEGEIVLSLEREKDRARIVVADNGIGIPRGEMPRIFDRFYRVDRGRSRELGGAGLGLSITRWIVGAHGGTITVQSEPNKGSTFTVELPAIA